jgi:hypothetical protein
MNMSFLSLGCATALNTRDLSTVIQQVSYQVMPDTMDLNVTTPNDNPSALVRYATVPHGEITVQAPDTLRCVW